MQILFLFLFLFSYSIEISKSSFLRLPCPEKKSKFHAAVKSWCPLKAVVNGFRFTPSAVCHFIRVGSPTFLTSVEEMSSTRKNLLKISEWLGQFFFVTYRYPHTGYSRYLSNRLTSKRVTGPSRRGPRLILGLVLVLVI